jgi:hypothetical protein
MGCEVQGEDNDSGHDLIDPPLQKLYDGVRALVDLEACWDGRAAMTITLPWRRYDIP